MEKPQLTNREIYDIHLPNGSIYGKIGQQDIKRFKFTAKHILPGVKSVLDVGCFGGDWLHYLLGRFSMEKHLGIDVSQSKIDEAKKQFPELDLRVGFAEKLDFPPASFDVVTCLEVLEHIPDWLPVLHSLLRYASRQVLITVPYKEKIIYTPCIHCGKLTPLYAHLRSYTEDSFPVVKGWSISFTKIPFRDPNLPLAAKIILLVKPRYKWLLVDYQRLF